VRGTFNKLQGNLFPDCSFG